VKILFVTARFPYPPLTGDKIIAYQRLKYLSEKHEITLLSFSDECVDNESVAQVAKCCKEICLVPLRKSQAYSNLMLHGFGKTPLQVLYYKSKYFRTKLDELLAENRYDLIHTFMLRVAPYVCGYERCAKIVELIDSMELNMLRRASSERGIRKMIFAEEAKRLSRYEANVAKQFDRAVVVSGVDAKTIGTGNAVVNPLGVDPNEFYPRFSEDKDPSLVIFTGNMRYFPNERAVLHFARDIFPPIQEALPDARFQVIGAGPSHRVRRLENENKAIRVLGFVNSMSDHINRASVSVCPMLAGSGMQFKILEALACGIPVVATSVAKGDIQVYEDDGLFIADEPAAFADRVVGIIEDEDLRTNIADKAPKAVERRYSWRRSNSAIDRIYSELSPRRDRCCRDNSPLVLV